MNKKVIISIVFFLIVAIGTISMVEFYYAKDSGRTPVFAIKTENRSKQYYKYSSLLYNAYKCYSDKVYALPKGKEPTCNRIIVYKDGYYMNINGLKISKKDYQTIYDVVYKFDEIEKFSTEKELKTAVFIADEYEKNLFKLIKTIKVKKEIVNIKAFKDLVKNEYGDYHWTYMVNDENYYKCEKDGLYKDYKNGDCLGEWKPLSYSSKWCDISKDLYNLNIRDTYNKYCK